MTIIPAESSPENESRTQAIGREIFQSAHVGRIANWLMARPMRDASIKSRLFRFVDALPVLKTSGQIAEHLFEYLGPSFPNLSRLVDPKENAGILLAHLARWSAKKMARRFIAAEDMPGAVKAISNLRKRRLASTLDLLGENVVSEREADAYQRQYLNLLKALPPRLNELPEDELLDRDDAGPIPRANISIKLSSLYSQFDAIDPKNSLQKAAKRLRPILRSAREAGAFINLDMEHHAFKNLTLRVFQSVLMEDEFRDWKNVGIAIQAYLRGTLNDLRNLAEWVTARGTSVWVRLVKGAYWDMECVIADQNGWPHPAFDDKHETDANFESAAEFLIANHKVLRPAIASHNIRSIAAASALAERYKLAPHEMEYQMLYGMAEPIKRALVERGARVRVYTPFGNLLPGMAYLVRRLLENTSNESFLRAGFIEHVPMEKLLMNPNNHAIKAARFPTRVFQNESPSDFAIEANRKHMQSAIEQFRPVDFPLIIGGREITTGQWIESINPSHTSKIAGRCARAGVEHANDAVSSAKLAFETWRDVAVNERAALLGRVADAIAERRFELAAVEVHECAKPWREADADICEAIDFLRYYARQMRELAKPAGNNVPGETNQWLYESRGPAVIIAPWNFPLAILCGMASAAVVAGNPVILKPAEQSSVIAAYLAREFANCGAPAGVVNYLSGIGEEIGPALISHPDVAMIAFTGSRAVGLGINLAGSTHQPGQDHVKRIITEMGGKNAIIVDEDADLDEAVTGIVASAFGYSGQKCSACSRVIAINSVHDALLSRLIEAAKSLKIAPAEDPGCRVGPVIDSDAWHRMDRAIEVGKTEANLAWAGDVGSLAQEGYYIAPHLFSEVKRSSALATEEIFGPVLSIMRAGNLTEALNIANDTSYALTGGIYSRSPANLDRARREFRVGNLYINRKITGALVGRQPFGGFKLSGAGTQAGGPDYLRHFLMPRCVTENTVRHGMVDEA